jgi:C-terminal processing protease CtpA/Prc
MPIRVVIVIFVALFELHPTAAAQNLTREQYRADFAFFHRTIAEYYCYFDKKQTDWAAVDSLYAAATDTVTGMRGFIAVLEAVLHELYDHHASLGVNTQNSPRLVPSGTDLWAEFQDDRAVITDVLPGSPAARAGLCPQLEVRACNGLPVLTAIRPFLARTLRRPDPAARDYALRVLLAGNYAVPRTLTVWDGREQRDVTLPLPASEAPLPALESRRIGATGYLRINNRLFDNDLIAQFDSALGGLMDARALILDMRFTPSGGNTTVARAILGSFIRRDEIYQRHELTAEERAFGVRRSWLEVVSPRRHTYAGPLVVLCGHWTGSVGEGITIGFDGMRRATVIGTPMAGLNGAIYSFTLPNSGIAFSIAAEKLFHRDGRPREEFRPRQQVAAACPSAGDVALEAALEFLKRGAKH